MAQERCYTTNYSWYVVNMPPPCNVFLILIHTFVQKHNVHNSKPTLYETRLKG